MDGFTDDLLRSALQSGDLFDQQPVSTQSYVPVYQPTYQTTYQPIQQQQQQQQVGQAILKELRDIKNLFIGQGILKELREVNTHLCKLQSKMQELECGIQLRTDKLIVPVTFLPEKELKRTHETGQGAHAKDIKKTKAT